MPFSVMVALSVMIGPLTIARVPVPSASQVPPVNVPPDRLVIATADWMVSDPLLAKTVPELVSEPVLILRTSPDISPEIVPRFTRAKAPVTLPAPSSNPPAATVLALVIVSPDAIVTVRVDPLATIVVMRRFPEDHGGAGVL